MRLISSRTRASWQAIRIRRISRALRAISASMRNASSRCTVAIDAATRRLVHPLFEIAPRGLVELKGKRDPLACFEVTGVRTVPGSEEAFKVTRPLDLLLAEALLARRRVDRHR